MKKYDYIITGSGASGLILAYRMANDAYFDDKSILLIDREKKSKNDRTWSYWETGEGDWDDILTKSWDTIEFKSDWHSEQTPIAPYSYKMLRSTDLYEKIWKVLETKENISFVEDDVLNISHRTDQASILTQKTEYHAKKVFNSIFFDKGYQHQSKYPVLKQHFLGWFIETKEDVFEDTVATFMDFTIEQRGNTRFMYVLPISSNKALFEYTLFSKDILDKDEYESEIQAYLKEKNIQSYTIVEKEQGVIPMTSYNFWKHNSKNVLNMGTAGGWSKASTGYTFGNISKRTKELIEYIKTGESLREFGKPTRFWWYDLLLLDLLDRDNHKGSKLFAQFFKNNSVQKIFKFLDDETSFKEDLRIMFSMPPFRFLGALFKRLF